MSDAPRRTQRERREGTIAKLLDAAIQCLIEHGYRDTSISRICDRAGVSQGGLFRHFSSRTTLMVATTEEICRRHMAQFDAMLQDPTPDVDLPTVMVGSFREAAQMPLTAAWREILLAARTNAELSGAIAPAVQDFEDAIMDLAARVPGAPEDTRVFGTLILSILHMYDSDATTIDIVYTDDINQIRNAWAIQLLRDALKS
jgi:AcrR family transcriptional regulator